MTTNEYKIKLTGSACIPQPLKNGFEYDLELKNVEVRKIERIPTDDGKEDEIASLRISELSEIILKSNGKEMKATKKGGQSKVYRYLVQQLAEKKGLDPDKLYTEKMNKNIEDVKLELDN